MTGPDDQAAGQLPELAGLGERVAAELAAELAGLAPREMMAADPVARAMVDAHMKLTEGICQLLELLSGRIRQVDERAGITIDQLAAVVANLAERVAVLSDRIGMLELDSQKGGQP